MSNARLKLGPSKGAERFLAIAVEQGLENLSILKKRESNLILDR